MLRNPGETPNPPKASFEPDWISRIVLLGRTRCGKTRMSKTIQASFSRRVILDMVNDYTSADGAVFSDYRAFATYVMKNQYSKAFTAIFKFSIHDDNKTETANEIFRLMFSLRNVLLVVDECQYYGACHYLDQLVLVGARHGIAILASTQRPANISKNLMSQSSDVFVGQLYEPNDVKYLREFLPPEDIARIPSIPPYHFLHFRSGHESSIVKNA